MQPDKLLCLVDRFLLRMSLAASDYLEWDMKKGLYHVTKLTCVALCLTMTEISDAVAFMCTLRFFKRAELSYCHSRCPLTTFFLDCCARHKKGVKKGSSLFPFFTEFLKGKVLHFIWSTLT